MQADAERQLQAMKNAAQIEVKKIDALTKGFVVDGAAGDAVRVDNEGMRAAGAPAARSAQDVALLLQAMRNPTAPVQMRVVRDAHGLIAGLEVVPSAPPPAPVSVPEEA